VIDGRFLRRHLIFPDVAAGVVWYSTDTPAWALAQALTSSTEWNGLVPVERQEGEILENIGRMDSDMSAADVIGQTRLADSLNTLLQEGVTSASGDESDPEAPIIRMVNAVVKEAIDRRASDIHFEPYDKNSVVRFRIDGVLMDVAHPARSLHAALISRIKVMSQLDIAEKRLPQDGRMTFTKSTSAVDLRVSTLPTGAGERAVLRLLRKDSGLLSMSALGMSEEMLVKFRTLIRKPFGILLVTGPTGSGKTTTLYAALNEIDAKSLNVMTVEDPIEFEIPGVSQTQVHPKIGLTFAHCLRSILRQDPDVILIGEIRDVETARIAIQASLTGHLVLATLHTNDSPSAVGRLLDMGVEPFLLASSLLAVMSQRLVRKLDPKQPRLTYSGRTGIFELLLVTDAIRSAIKTHEDASSVRRIARQEGFYSMVEDGQRLLDAGVTTLEELKRVTQDESGDLDC